MTKKRESSEEPTAQPAVKKTTATKTKARGNKAMTDLIEKNEQLTAMIMSMQEQLTELQARVTVLEPKKIVLTM